MVEDGRNACIGAPDMAIMQPNVQTSPWQGAGVSFDFISAGLGWRRIFASAAAAKSLQSCPTLCDPKKLKTVSRKQLNVKQYGEILLKAVR